MSDASPMIANLGGARISYTDVGEGEPVLLISGFASGKEYWSKAAELLDGFRVIAFDNRGVGETEYDGDFDFDDMISDVLGLLDHLSIEKAHVVGWSMGSLIARGFASRHPDRVADLTIIASYVRRPARAWYLLRKFSDMFSEGRIGSSEFYGMVNAMTFSEVACRRFEESGRRMPEPDIVQKAEGLVRQLDAIDFIETHSSLVDVQCPTLIIHGTDDHTVSFEEAGKLQKEMVGSRLLALEGEGHSIPMKVYSEVLKGFMREHPSSG